MLVLLIALLIFRTQFATCSNVGSVLFHNRNCRECWSEDDLVKLRARRIFENIALPQVTPDKINSKYLKKSLRYYRRALEIIDKNLDKHNAKILKDALADTLGGHLRSEMLPTVRFAYYAGYVPYRSARQLHNFLGDLKMLLNTQGLGWKEPPKVPQWSNLTVAKVLIGIGKLFDPCAYLVVKRDSNSCIHLPPPKLDNEVEPSAIALPFKIGGLVSLTASNSENILLKYYTTASRCILRNSPETCRHSDFVNFNNELWHWMKRDVAPHLMDEKLYAAYGGVLRIAAAVQNYGKGLARRNLYDYEDYGEKWHPWKTLTTASININADWTPQLYIGVIFMIMLAIFLVQMFYSYLFGRSGCHCKGRIHKPSYPTKEVAYTNVETNFPAMLPDQSETPTPKKEKRLIKCCKSACVGTVRTERVYDLNENTEKFMPVIMSDGECSLESIPSSKESEEYIDSTVIDLGNMKRSISPPKIEAPMAQLKIDKSPVDRSRKPRYSTSTATRSELTYHQGVHVSDTAWTASASSSSDRSLSSGSSKSATRQTRGTRDLAWARKVISKQSTRDTTSLTGGNVDSFITPPSRR